MYAKHLLAVCPHLTLRLSVVKLSGNKSEFYFRAHKHRQKQKKNAKIKSHVLRQIREDLVTQKYSSSIQQFQSVLKTTVVLCEIVFE